jgi:hypothetical protein
MPVTPTALARANAVSGTNTLVFSGTGSPTIITNVVVANSGTVAGAFTLSISGIPLLGAVTVPANSSAFFDLKQVVNSGTTVSGFATISGISYHISGVTIS